MLCSTMFMTVAIFKVFSVVGSLLVVPSVVVLNIAGPVALYVFMVFEILPSSVLICFVCSSSVRICLLALIGCHWSDFRENTVDYEPTFSDDVPSPLKETQCDVTIDADIHCYVHIQIVDVCLDLFHIDETLRSLPVLMAWV